MHISYLQMSDSNTNSKNMNATQKIAKPEPTVSIKLTQEELDELIFRLLIITDDDSELASMTHSSRMNIVRQSKAARITLQKRQKANAKATEKEGK